MAAVVIRSATSRVSSQPVGASRRTGRGRATFTFVALGVVAASTALFAAPAEAAAPVTAHGVKLSSSATCTFGDIEATYTANGVERQNVSFTQAGGAVLDQFEDHAYDPHYDGTEFILSETTTPPPAGTVVAVHVTIGTTPPQAATTAEFIVVYRCDARGNDVGGTNTVLYTCYGDYGSCPTTADTGLAAAATTTTTTTATATTPPPAEPATPATPVAARPSFTG